MFAMAVLGAHTVKTGSSAFMICTLSTMTAARKASSTQPRPTACLMPRGRERGEGRFFLVSSSKPKALRTTGKLS